MRYAALGESFSVILSTRRIVGLRLHMYLMYSCIHSHPSLSLPTQPASGAGRASRSAPLFCRHGAYARALVGVPVPVLMQPNVCDNAPRRGGRMGTAREDSGFFLILRQLPLLSLEMLEDSEGHQRSTALMSIAACHATQMTG